MCGSVHQAERLGRLSRVSRKDRVRRGLLEYQRVLFARVAV